MDHFPKEKEKILIEQSQKGDEKAFSSFIELYKSRIFFVCKKIIHNEENAQDLTQETFLHAFDHIRDFKGKARLYTWLYRIAVNLSLNALKKKQRMRVNELKEEILPRSEHQKALKKYFKYFPKEIVDREELIEVLQEALSSLSFEHQEIFILYVLQRLPQKKIAELLGINYGTVRSRLHYARKRILELCIELSNDKSKEK